MKFFLRLKILLVLLFLIIGQQLTFGQYFSAGNEIHSENLLVMILPELSGGKLIIRELV